MNLAGNVFKVFVKMIDRRRLPRIQGTINLPGLQGSVSITRDNHGVPHIRASSMHDVFFAQGFCHAQDRLWQMELNRRTATGRLSEIFGKIALDTDRTARVFGWKRIGEKDIEEMDDELRLVLEAYTKGVNAHINSLETKLPTEFSLIKHRPQLWTIEDSMALARFMVWQLSHAWYGEVIRAKLIEAVGPEYAAELEIHYPEGNPNTLPSGLEFNKYIKGVLKKAKDPLLKQSMGSNAWVISKELSSTGSPILCNDMHLEMSLPSLWYVNHLKAEELNITGVSVPGIPMILVGHNSDISWGMTLAFTDAEDLYIEKFESETTYLFKNKKLEAEQIKEVIKVKDEIPHTEIVTITKHGPIISDVVDIDDGERIAVQSKALQPSPALRGWYKLNIAKNWDDFCDAIRDIEAPQLNIMYADSENIGHYVSGKVPQRAKGHTGMVPVPGWDGKNEWKGDIPFEEMPHAFNPERGFLVTCNNKVIDDDYPHYLGGMWMNGYRARRIESYFNSLDKIGIEDCKKMQLDFHCLPGLEFIKHLEDVKINDIDERVNQAFKLLKDWDGELTADSVGGCLYEVTRYMAVRKMLDPHLGEELTETLMGTGFHPILLASHEFYGHDTTVLLRALDNPDSWWIKQAGGKENLLRESFNAAYAWLRSNIGLDYTKWTWGSIHKIEFVHSMATQKPMDVVFNQKPVAMGGDTDTPCQMAMYPNEPYNARSWVPSWRQIINMGDVTASEFMYAPGQSGQLTSSHYGDLIGKWCSGIYETLFWTRGQIEGNSEGLLVLGP